MNAAVVRKWILALRSGRYKQSLSSLKTDDCFCALGALCELHRQEFGGEWTAATLFKNPDGSEHRRWEYMGFCAGPSGAVIEWIGIDSTEEAKIGKYNNWQTSVWALNDTEHWSFNQIADYLEQRLLPWDTKLQKILEAIYNSHFCYPPGSEVMDFLTLKILGKISDFANDPLTGGTPLGTSPLIKDTKRQLEFLRCILLKEMKKTDFGYCLWHELNHLLRIIDS